MKRLLFLTLVVLHYLLPAQNITAYVDNRGYFYVFDNGKTINVEYQQPQSFQIGGNCVAYMDYNQNFKVYYNGEVTTLHDGVVGKYQTTHNLLVYFLGSNMYVFEKGHKQLVSNYVVDYQVADSLIAFRDAAKNAFCVYYRGNILTLEDFYKTQNILQYSASNNTVAWLSYIREFKIFWNGGTYNIFTLPNINVQINYQTGSNIVSFVTNNLLGLNVFYKGNLYNLTNKQVTNFQTGDDMVAFTDMGGFHVFYAGKTYDLNAFSPDTFRLADSTLIYYTPGYFSVFNKGKSQVLENFMPEDYAIDNNTLAYIDLQGGLKAFYNDETYALSSFDHIIGFKLMGNAIWYSTATVYNRVFLKGEKY